jgi:hypothetical protein
VPIRWSAVKVSGTADKIEEFVKQAAEPLEKACIVAREARTLANLPQYIDQDLTRIITDIDRAIGGSQFEPIGRVRTGIEAIRRDIPTGAIYAERESAKHGTTDSLV